MLTLKDCLDFCELGDEQIRAIAEHEGVPEIVAAQIGSALNDSEEGKRAIERFLGENIGKAKAENRPRKAKRLERALNEFKESQA